MADVNDNEATLKKRLAEALAELRRNVAELKSRQTELPSLSAFEDLANLTSFLSLVSDEDLADELRRRGYRVTK